MKVAIFETGHEISNKICRTVADACGFDLYNLQKNAPNLFRHDAVLAYGILRGTAELFKAHPHWFCIDKGFWNAEHYEGLYRFAYRNTQPLYGQYQTPQADHGQILQPWRDTGYTLICPPTEHVCEFFGVNGWEWAHRTTNHEQANNTEWRLRPKSDEGTPIDWDNIGKLVTFNSSLGFEALKRGIPVISDPDHSTIGSFQKNAIDPTNRDELFSFASGHMKKLTDREGIWSIVNQYISGGIPVKPLPRTSYATRFSAELPAEWT